MKYLPWKFWLPWKPWRPIDALPTVKAATESMSEQEWAAWKRRYWHDERLGAKNERFVAVVGKYLGRANELLLTRKDITMLPAIDAVKAILRDLHYKSKVVPYNAKFFHQGVVAEEIPDLPILWASNGHIGVSALLFADDYVHHGPARAPVLRFEWSGHPVLCELPQREARTFYLSDSSGP